MRGYQNPQPKLFVRVQTEDFIPDNHPLRWIKDRVDRILEEMSWSFEGMYSPLGRPSIPPEQLLKGELLRILYTIRSERQLMEQTQYNLLYRWFVGLGIDEVVWDASSYSHNRDRLMSSEIAGLFFQKVLEIAEEEELVSEEHFSVDGTLLEACASLKSFKAKDGSSKPPEDDDPGNPTVDFKGEKRSNQTHESTTDPESRLFTKNKGKEAKLCYMGHITMENRHGLAVSVRLTKATGTAEREASVEMLSEVRQKSGKSITVGQDKGYDTAEHVRELREQGITPHVAQKKNSAIDGRTTRHAGYAVSQRKRKRIEEIFGWLKDIGGLRKLRHRGQLLVDWMFTFTVSAYNLVRIRKLKAA